jgi:hypothetical protein
MGGYALNNDGMCVESVDWHCEYGEKGEKFVEHGLKRESEEPGPEAHKDEFKRECSIRLQIKLYSSSEFWRH